MAELAGRLVPGWIRTYKREWLSADLVASLIVWSVVTPQCVAYAQIAGLPPQAGLMAAPGAMIGYALIGGSRSLIVSATTATAGVSAAAVGPLAGGDASKFAALSAALALMAAVVFLGSGLLRLGGVTDLISKPVMTGFLFGLGMTIAIGQAPKIFGVKAGSGNFFPQLADLIDNLGSTQATTLAVGAASIALLLAFKRLAPSLPGTLIVLVAGIVVSSVLHLSEHGVDVVGKLPSALPDPSVPQLSAQQFVDLLPASFGILLLSTEGLGVARSLASKHHYAIDANREFAGVGVSNLLAGLSSGFVQCGGSSQTAAAEEAGGKSQLASVLGAGLILLTGGLLTGVFTNLPEATLGAIVIVSVMGFFRVGELSRFGRVRNSALLLSLVALGGVLAFGVLPGLLIAAGLSLMLVIYRLSRPSVGELARDPVSGAWGRVKRHPEWQRVPGALVVNVEGPLFYANSVQVKDALIHMVGEADPKPATVALELTESSDLDLQALDTLGELVDELAAQDIELVLAAVRVPVLELMRRQGLADKVRIESRLDDAVVVPTSAQVRG